MIVRIPVAMAYVLMPATGDRVVRSIGAFGARSAIAAVLCAGALACNSDSTGPRPVADRAVAVSYCAAVTPTWVAFRDGDGAWTRETPSVTGSTTTFRHSFTSNRAAIASLTPVLDGEFTVLRVLYGAPEELSTDGDTTSPDCLTGAFKSLRGTVAGIATTEAAFIAIGPLARTGVVPREGLDFTIDGVAAGPQDLLAVRTAQAAPPRLIIRRDLDLPNGSVVPTLDFASSEAFDMVAATLTIGNLGGEGNPVVDFSVLTTAHGEFSSPSPPVAMARRSHTLRSQRTSCSRATWSACTSRPMATPVAPRMCIFARRRIAPSLWEVRFKRRPSASSPVVPRRVFARITWRRRTMTRSRASCTTSRRALGSSPSR